MLRGCPCVRVNSAGGAPPPRGHSGPGTVGSRAVGAVTVNDHRVVAEPFGVRRPTEVEGQKLRRIVRRSSTSTERFRRAMMLPASAGGSGVPVIANHQVVGPETRGPSAAQRRRWPSPPVTAAGRPSARQAHPAAPTSRDLPSATPSIPSVYRCGCNISPGTCRITGQKHDQKLINHVTAAQGCRQFRPIGPPQRGSSILGTVDRRDRAAPGASRCPGPNHSPGHPRRRRRTARPGHFAG